MPHKTTKKLLGRAKKKIKDIYSRPRKDRLPDIPGPDPLLNVAAAALGLTPVGRGLLMGYMAAENTERWWGPPVEATGGYTAKQWEEYQDWFERNVRSRYAGSEIDPNSPWNIPEGYGYQARGPMGPPEPVPQRVKRKVSKANKATKRAYRFLANSVKGKMTQKRCCDILKKAAKMAGRANPNTPSRIGKGRTPMKTECRKIRKSIWNTTRRN
jgi:hypothetical protein